MLEDHLAFLKKENIGLYVSLGPKLIDVLVLSARGPTNSIKIPLSLSPTTNLVKIMAKTLGNEELSIGSISIP